MDTNNLQQQIDELRAELQLLKASSTIPLETENAFRERLKPVAGSSNASSAVSVGSFPAAGVMAGFITIVFEGTSRKVPYYS